MNSDTGALITLIILWGGFFYYCYKMWRLHKEEEESK